MPPPMENRARHRRRHLPDSQPRGSSLVEVMVVVVLITLAAAVAVPAYLSWLPDIRLRDAARDLYATMQEAKTLAVKETRDVAVVFDVAGGQYLLCSDAGADGSWSSWADNTVVRTTVFATDYGQGVGYGHGSATSAVGSGFDDEVTYAGNVVVFSPDGLCNPGYVYLDNVNANKTYAVGSTVSGSVRLQRWLGTGWQ